MIGYACLAPRLALQSTGVTDAGLDQLAVLPALKDVVLSPTAVIDAGRESPQRSKSLRRAAAAACSDIRGDRTAARKRSLTCWGDEQRQGASGNEQQTNDV